MSSTLDYKIAKDFSKKDLEVTKRPCILEIEECEGADL